MSTRPANPSLPAPAPSRPAGDDAGTATIADVADTRSPVAAALAAPMDRRRALAVIGSTVAAAALLEACGGDSAAAARGWVTADIDPTTLVVDQPVPARFSGTVAGAQVSGSVWLVLREANELVAFDPKCTHASCAYEWTDKKQFACLCHEGFFDIDGNVVSGPPKHPLNEYRVRTADGAIELYVPSDFATPRPTG